MRSKEEMAAYQKERRLRLKDVTLHQTDVTKVVTPALNVTSNVTPETKCYKFDVTSCQGCSDKDMANKILRAKVLMLERELVLLKREKKADQEETPKSPYRLGPGI